jgi:hypothetical protein
MNSANTNAAVRAEGPSDESRAQDHGRGELLVPNPKRRLREQLREVMRFKHYSVRTEQTYWHWIRHFILFHQGDGRGAGPRLSHASGGAAQCGRGHAEPGAQLGNAERRTVNWRGLLA